MILRTVVLSVLRIVAEGQVDAIKIFPQRDFHVHDTMRLGTCIKSCGECNTACRRAECSPNNAHVGNACRATECLFTSRSEPWTQREQHMGCSMLCEAWNVAVLSCACSEAF